MQEMHSNLHRLKNQFLVLGTVEFVLARGRYGTAMFAYMLEQSFSLVRSCAHD